MAIIGGIYPDQKGMDIWNPRTREVKLLWEVIPPEEGGSQGLQSSVIILLKRGEEFILYGGYQGSLLDAIWKYTSAENTWIR